MSKIIDKKIEAEQSAKKLIDAFCMAIKSQARLSLNNCIERFGRIDMSLLSTDTYCLLGESYCQAKQLLNTLNKEYVRIS